MNFQHIIDHKIAYLSGEISEDISDDMQAYMNDNPLLKKEIDFIEKFWQPQADIAEEMPSTNLDKAFYAMLARAQEAEAQRATVLPVKPSLWQKLSDIISLKHVMQAAAMGACVMVGFTLNNQNQPGIDNLHQEVKTLSSLVATSMLQKQSASARLTGISFSKQADRQDSGITTSLLDTLESDHSTAVRLAAIDALSDRDLDQETLANLVKLTTEQEHPLVQISLVKLIMNTGEIKARKMLSSPQVINKLHPDTNEFLAEIQRMNQI